MSTHKIVVENIVRVIGTMQDSHEATLPAGEVDAFREELSAGMGEVQFMLSDGLGCREVESFDDDLPYATSAGPGEGLSPYDRYDPTGP